MLKSIRRFFRKNFRNDAYCRSRDLFGSDPRLVSVLVLVRIWLLGGAKACYCWEAKEEKCRLVEEVVRRRDAIPETLESFVSVESYEELITDLRNQGLMTLRNYRAPVKDGVRYEVSFVTREEKKDLDISNPNYGSKMHQNLIDVLEKWVRRYGRADQSG